MQKLVVIAALVAFAGCKTKDGSGDKPAAGDKMASGDTPAAGSDDVATVDCEKMTTHNVEVLMKDATAGKSDAEKKTMMDSITGQHATMVKACEDEKGTKKLTHKQYDCILASQSTVELTACLPAP
jgi:hypothetical protein